MQTNKAGVPRPNKWNKGDQVYLGKELYLKYLQSKNWYNKKKKYKKSGFPLNCWACESNKKIEFHHRIYGRLGWEAMTDIVPLCNLCHKELTDIYNNLEYKDNLLWSLTNSFIRRKRKSLSLENLPDQFFDDKLILKPHNVLHKVIKIKHQ